MVGVPGKSKGCTTCRRRKVKCDEGTPSCARCTNSGRTCEGYEKFPTFLNRTSEGMSKRGRLEEAKPRRVQSARVTTVGGAEVGSRVTAAAGTDDDGRTHQGYREGEEGESSSTLVLTTTHRPHHTSYFPVFIADGAVCSQQFLSNFLERYLPSRPSQNALQKCLWFPMVMNMGDNRKPALEAAVQAFSLTRVGWFNRDERLAVKGRAAYGKALKELQRALWDHKQMGSDETLAAGRLLAMYELYESTNSIKGWNNHESGIARMIKLRGTKSWQSTMGRAIFEDTRNSIMIQSIQNRKSSFFSEQAWLTTPWETEEKSFEQRLIDIGFRIADMQAEIDRTKEDLNGLIDIESSATFLNTCAEMNETLDSWYAEFEADSPSPVYWNRRPWNEHESKHVDHPGYVFVNLKIANALTLYWAMRIFTGLSVFFLTQEMRQMEEAARARTPPSTSSRSSDSGDEGQPDTRDTAASLAAHLGSLYPPTRTVQMARNITRTVEYSMDDAMGLFGAQRLVFPFRVALAIFRTHTMIPGVAEELQMCAAKYDYMTESRGLGYARDIGQQSGKWQAGS